jgi:type IV pilus assembly protein PilM
MSVGSFFSGLFKKEVSVLGIDIGSSAIKVVQVKKKRGRAILETYGELALGPYAGVEIGRATNLPNEKIVEALRDILREAKTTTTACGTALPLSSSLISFITIPPVDEKQLREIIPIEARKYIPVPMNEVMLDWSIVPREDEYASEEEVPTAPSTINMGASAAADPLARSFTNTAPVQPVQQNQIQPQVGNKKGQDVLVVAIHNEYINNYQSIMNGSGLLPTFYEIELFSSIRAVADVGVQAQMIVDMGARNTKLYIIERGVLRSSHIINRGAQDITLAISKSLSVSVDEAERMKRTFGLKGGPEHKDLTEIITVNLDYVFYEANATLLSYQKKYQKNVGKVVLTGGGVLLKGFTELAKISFKTDVIYADPFGKLQTPAFLAEQFSLAGPEFSVAIGVALRRLSEIE